MPSFFTFSLLFVCYSRTSLIYSRFNHLPGSSSASSYRFVGASHGGMGGSSNLEDDDSFSKPTHFGSGGGGVLGSPGGGAIHLKTGECGRRKAYDVCSFSV